MEKKKLKSSPHDLTKEDMLEFFKEEKASGSALKDVMDVVEYLHGQGMDFNEAAEPLKGWKALMEKTKNGTGKIVFLDSTKHLDVSEHFIKPKDIKIGVDLAEGQDMTAFDAMSHDMQKKMSANFGTMTGKMSSSEPNLSQIPKSGSEPMKIGKLFKPVQSKKLMLGVHDEMTYYPDPLTEMELKTLGMSKSYEVGTKSGFELFKTMMKSGKSEPTLSETVEQLKEWQKSPAAKAMGGLIEAYSSKWVDVLTAVELFEEDEGESPRLIELCSKITPQPAAIGPAPMPGDGEGPLWNHDEVDTFMNTATQTVEFKCKHCKRRWAVDKGEFTALITADRIKVLKSLFTEEWE
jgi:hypothetical protein